MAGMIEIMDKRILSRFTIQFLNLTLKEQVISVEVNYI